jgi:hypothetical protein
MAYGAGGGAERGTPRSLVKSVSRAHSSEATGGGYCPPPVTPMASHARGSSEGSLKGSLKGSKGNVEGKMEGGGGGVGRKGVEDLFDGGGGGGERRVTKQRSLGMAKSSPLTRGKSSKAMKGGGSQRDFLLGAKSGVLDYLANPMLQVRFYVATMEVRLPYVTRVHVRPFLCRYYGGIMELLQGRDTLS